jgi:adenylyltransferase and sulfurtransferase
LEPSTALDTVEQYDVVLDCTDHPTSRYLISDAAVIGRKPLVSASALRTEGQLLILNWPPSIPETQQGGICYRCVFPKPPPIESVIDCGAGGILGPVVGVMGVLLAVETIRIIINPQSIPPDDIPHPSLLLYSAFSYPPFRSIRLRGKRPLCSSCSRSATISRESLTSGSLDYNAFCGVTSNRNILPEADRISATEYSKVHGEADRAHILIDVREKHQFDICHLQHSLNIPFSSLPTDHREQPTPASNNPFNQILRTGTQPATTTTTTTTTTATPIYILCRYGNDSQLAVKTMKTWAHSHGQDSTHIRDIKGGLEAWRKEVDPRFPEY